MTTKLNWGQRSCDQLKKAQELKPQRRERQEHVQRPTGGEHRGGSMQHVAAPQVRFQGRVPPSPQSCWESLSNARFLGVQPVPAHILGFPCDSHHTHVLPPTRFSFNLAGLGLWGPHPEAKPAHTRCKPETSLSVKRLTENIEQSKHLREIQGWSSCTLNMWPFHCR